MDRKEAMIKLMLHYSGINETSGFQTVMRRKFKNF